MDKGVIAAAGGVVGGAIIGLLLALALEPLMLIPASIIALLGGFIVGVSANDADTGLIFAVVFFLSCVVALALTITIFANTY